MNENQSEKLFLITIFNTLALFLVGCFVFVYVTNLKHTKVPVVINSGTIEKPSYDYLKSVTIYILHPEKPGSPAAQARQQHRIDDGELTPEPADRFHGAVGTSTVVAEKNGYFYILTNKHVCGDEPVDGESFTPDKDNCYVKEDGLDLKRSSKGMVKIEYVASAKKGTDLELWRVEKVKLPHKKVVKGFNSVEIQEAVYSVGNYLAFNYIYTEGTKAGYDPFNDEIFNLPCTYGCSGSGIFNNNGELVSVLYAGNGVPTSFPVIQAFDTAKVIAIDYKRIIELLKKARIYDN